MGVRASDMDDSVEFKDGRLKWRKNMNSDEWGRRMDDKGQESPQVILARIDENIKFLKSGAEFVRIQLETHEIKDDKRFKENEEKMEKILRNIYIVTGGLGVVIFILNWLHK